MKSNERYAKEYEKYIRSSEWTIKKISARILIIISV